MAIRSNSERGDFNRTALTVQSNRAWYTGQRAERIPSGLIGILGSECTGLDLSYNNLVSVKLLREFLSLEDLVLDNNCLSDLNTLPHMPVLTTFSVNNNKLTDIESALNRIKECCPQVRYVSLLGNPGCPDQLTDPTKSDEDDYERYRRYAVHILPESLRFLDSRAVTQRERKEARERGGLMKLVKINLPNVASLSGEQFAAALEGKELFRKSNTANSPSTSDYTPLPKSIRGPLEVLTVNANIDTPVKILRATDS